MPIFYGNFNDVLASLMVSLTPMQLVMLMMFIIALSFSVATGMCNADMDDDMSEVTSCDVAESSDEYEDIHPSQVCKTCGGDYIADDDAPDGYCDKWCVPSERCEDDDEYMSQYRRALRKSRNLRNRKGNGGYNDNLERLCDICMDLYYLPNGPHWHSLEDREKYAKETME